MKPSPLPVLLLALAGCAGTPPQAVRAPAAPVGVAFDPPAWPAPARRDCPMRRALDGRAICAPAPRARTGATADRTVPSAATAADAREYVVIGSFSERSNAERWARRNAEFGTDVRSAGLSGAPIYRVVVGPLDDRDSAALMREILTRIGLDGSWQLALCAGTGPQTGCGPGDGSLGEAGIASMAER